MLRKMAWLLPCISLLSSCGHFQTGANSSHAGGDAPDMAKKTIQLSSPAFKSGGLLPRTYTCDGPNISPPLQWADVPESIKSLAIVCQDPDAPQGAWTHWLLMNITPHTTTLKENIPTQDTLPHGAIQGQNDFGKIGYGGACPPSGTHRYIFRIYALNSKLNIPAGATKAQVFPALQGHVIAEGELMSRYSR
ncbi:MAG: YbhB/YbcL family Raf kinase inhibitor-like protein [Abitibacteriaceae bacterium]|nr:YbhB/YbcL family Raf kinase inhibitor-like protein [Abditibacteriaceae bacterium]